MARVAAAQEADGYLNTAHGREGQEPRWTDLEWGHELYCLGHLFQAAVARRRTRPEADDGLVEIACRAADLVCETFGPEGIQGVCGHPEIETALAELGRATGTAALQRPSGPVRGTSGDRLPGADRVGAAVLPGRRTRARGHGAARSRRARELSRPPAPSTSPSTPVTPSCSTRWPFSGRTPSQPAPTSPAGRGRTTTGEAFGEDGVLPPDRAYSETCAGIASVMFSWRLLLARGDAQYADLIERTLYNVVATSPSSAGTAFYYANTLHQRVPGSVPDPQAASPRAQSSLRAPWFDVSCCPPNVARTLASLDAFVATADERRPPDPAVRTVHGGHDARGRTTDQPCGSKPTTRLKAWCASRRWSTPTIRGRCRSGCRTGPPAARLTVATDGETSTTTARARLHLRATRLPTGRPRRADPYPCSHAWCTRAFRVDAVRGCVAVERGPEVLCLESTDLDRSNRRRRGRRGGGAGGPSARARICRPGHRRPGDPVDAVTTSRLALRAADSRGRVRPGGGRTARALPRLGRARSVDDARVAAGPDLHRGDVVRGRSASAPARHPTRCAAESDRHEAPAARPA